MEFVLVLISAMLAYFSFRMLVSTYKAKKDLGEPLFAATDGLKSADRSQFFITLICLTFWGIAIWRYGTVFISSLYMLVLAVAMVIFFFISVIQLNVVPGFYEKYVATGSMICAYSDVRQYEIAPHRRRKGLSYVYINGRAGLLSSGIRVLVNDKDLPEIKRLLKKKVK